MPRARVVGFCGLQYVREVAHQLCRVNLLKDVHSVKRIPLKYWKTSARAKRPEHRDFVSIYVVTDCRFFFLAGQLCVAAR